MSNLMERVVGELFKSGAAANVMRHRKISFSYCEILGSDANDCLSPSHDAVKIGEMLDGRVVLKNLSEQISGAVAALESPSAVLLDFSTRLEMFTRLEDRASIQEHWPSLLTSARALVNERLSKLERDR